jgi:hypothetical protein
MLGAVMLMANFVGYLRGHYPQNFDLDDNQRTLILQTMMFMAWLAGGAAIFTRLEGWTYANALYFCDIVSGRWRIMDPPATDHGILDNIDHWFWRHHSNKQCSQGVSLRL